MLAFSNGSNEVTKLGSQPALLAAESAEGYQNFVNAISFPLTSVGVPDYVLKINLRRKDSLIYLSIENYIDKLAKDFGMEDCRTYYTPMEKGHELSKQLSPDEGSDELKKMEKTPYRSLLGALQYACLLYTSDAADE